ncbi:MAG: TonB-dependent receptor [Pseudomonadales bacterium]
MKTTKNRTFKRHPLAAAVGIASALTVGLPANASVLEEVVVTAQKREQVLQDVGIAVTAFTGTQMRKLGVTQSIDIAAFTPGVHIGGNLAGQNTQFTIRGVTQNDFADIVEAPVAVYVDEAYIALANGQTFSTFDIDRVEILRGPQGTLFGRNATGGLAQYVTNKPTFDTEGYVDVTAVQFDVPNNANAYTVEAAVSGGLSESVAARVAVKWNKQDPYLENTYPDGAVGSATFGFGTTNSPGPGAGADLGDDDTKAVRLSLLFEPNENLAVNLSASYADTTVSTGPYQSKPTIGIYSSILGDPNNELISVINPSSTETRRSICSDGSDCGSDQDDDGVPDDFDGVPGVDVGRFAPGGDFFGYLDPDGKDFTFSSDFAFEDQGFTEAQGLLARVDWQLSDSVSFVSLTDYKAYEKLLFVDVDAAAVNQLANYAGVDASTWTQEFRLSGDTDSMRWVTGLIYLHVDTDADNGLKVVNNGIAAGNGAIDVGVNGVLETDSYSVFGQLEWDLSDQLMLTTGLRLIREEKEYQMDNSLYASIDPSQIHVGAPFVTLRTFNAETDDGLWAGKVQLDWRPSDDMLMYAGVNRGVKAGSFNMPLNASVPNAVVPYNEEVLLSYEAGLKWTVLDGTTRINAAIFHYDYEDYQAFLFTGVGGLVINRDATTDGIELEVQSSPIDGLDLLFNVAYFDAEVENVPLSATSSITLNVNPTYAPEFQAAALARYEWQIGSSSALAVQSDVSYSDEFFYNLRNFDADKFDSYVKWNASVSWISEQHEISVAVRNITDERIGVQGFDTATICGCNEVSYQPARSFAVSYRYSF